ncbi:hypothetical protein OHB05_28340 [Streptomyces sp. NBC_00638]|uniref:hypothetical protein n=2 Tax=unclassified Streptomyces TaxID=2593676 RepID=UPI00224E9E54|nr:hypothetical protein [Streptomyces sp. NBC_00638]MCX4988292.1 hypothetical protein [Streptomyces sp. NBC_00568]MCX5006503.1 hypothetical protein [Streptomyces sp. NBC_00638]
MPHRRGTGQSGTGLRDFFERHLMLFLVAALLLLGVVMGSVAHAPLPVTLVAAAVIGVWLVVFALRERNTRRRHPSTN